ncbi:MAG: response regulator [Rhodobacteraceae bacterium]|nr:response regulator [Paracoccaceae bacterium]
MKRVLAVDDTITFRIMLSNCLKGGGHEVIEAADGKQALEKLRETQPDIVITDLNMPVMDGLDFIEAARAEGRSLPMLLLTTEVAESLKQRAREVGATGWLTKPFDPAQILRLVDQLA